MPLIRFAAALFAFAAMPALLHAEREKLPPDDYDIVMKRWPDAKISNTGIRYVVEKQGTGPLLQPGDVVMVNYVGQLLDGKVFDQNHSKEKPFTFRVARGEVILGWDQLFQIMRPGDKWLIIVPPELGYGRRGLPPAIPSYTTLVFDVEILGIKKDR